MDDPTLHAHLRASGERFASALGTSVLSDPVTSCPGWDVQRLASHLGRVHRSVTIGLRTGDIAAVAHTPPSRAPRDATIVEWFSEGFGELCAELTSATAPTRANEPVATWFGVQPQRFWLRRMAHETTMHVWDLLHAGESGGSTGAADAFLAQRGDAFSCDGVDELCAVFLDGLVGEEARRALDGRSLHLHGVVSPAAIGHPGEWLLHGDADGLHWSHGHEKADVAVRGPAPALLLWCWGRVGSTSVEVFGAPEAVAAWQHALHF